MSSLCLSLALLLVTVSTQPGWSDASVSCDFKHGDCGWEDGGLQLKWEHWNSYFSGDYMSLKMRNAKVNDKGALFSPWINGLANQICELQFRYYLKGDNACQLAVYRRTEANRTALWITSSKTSGNRLRSSPSLKFWCSESRFQIVFEGKKISSDPCGYAFKEIDIDSIVFKRYRESWTRKATTTTTTTTTTATVAVTTTREIKTTPPKLKKTEDNSEVSKVIQPTTATEEDESDSGLSTWTLVGIVLGAVVVAVVVGGVVAVCLRRRRTRKQSPTDQLALKRNDRGRKKRPSQSPRLPNAASNCSYTLDDHQIQVRTDPAGSQIRSDQAGSLHLYSTVDDNDGYVMPVVLKSRSSNNKWKIGRAGRVDCTDASTSGAHRPMPSASLPPLSMDDGTYVNVAAGTGQEGDYSNIAMSASGAKPCVSPSASLPLSENIYEGLKVDPREEHLYTDL